jgi:UDP-N-acetylmuramoyl-tripeptide--D-alanyl-D-alanine ligase
MNLSDLYQLYLHHPQVSTDSRRCPAGSLFFALKGKNFDGNQFAAQALATGADYAVIDNPACAQGERTLVVDDALQTLQALARRHRKTMAGLTLIGITGTNGKTTTKELLAAVLSTKFNLLCTEGNLNNQIGVPLSLLRLTYEHEMAVIEMGASRPGEIRELAEIAQPDYGIVTNIGEAHLEGFGSLDNIRKTKGELYDYLRKNHGRVFIKKEDETLQAMAEGVEQITYGSADEAFASGCAVAAGDSPFFTFNWKQQGKLHTVETRLVGAYNLDNALAAVAAGRYFKIPAERISRAIASYEPSNRRSQLEKTLHNNLVIDAYNANPSSMRAALRNFAQMPVSPKAVILGDMKELGAESLRLHREILREVANGPFDKAYLCGEYFSRAAGGTFPAYPSVDALIDALSPNPPRGFYILLKASRGMELEKVTGIL